MLNDLLFIATDRVTVINIKTDQRKEFITDNMSPIFYLKVDLLPSSYQITTYAAGRL